MSVVGISMFWNESDVAEYVVKHMIDECDYVIVADNNSDDGTREILECIDDPHLTIVDEPRFAYEQARTMNWLSEMAREDYGATWVIPFDMDEWWLSPAWPIKDVLPALDTLQVRAGGYEFHPQPSDDPTEHNPFRRVVWRREITPNFKVAFRPKSGKVLSFGNHFVYESDAWEEVSRNTLFIRHVPYRSLEQAMAKSRHGKAALEATGQGPTLGWHWRHMGGWTDAEFAAWWETWLDPAGLVKDPTPLVLHA